MPSSPTLLGSSASPTFRDDISGYKNSLLKGHASDLSGKGALSGTTYARDDEQYHDLNLQPGMGHFTGTLQGGVIYPSPWNGVDPGYGGAYPQLPESSRLQLGIGSGASSRSPPIPRSPRPTTYQPYPVQPDYAARPPYPSDVPHQQNPVAVIATNSQYQGSAFVQDEVGRPYYQQWYHFTVSCSSSS